MDVTSPALEIQTVTPLLHLHKEHTTLPARMDDRATSGEEFDRLYVLFQELEVRMAAEPVTCMGNLAAKILALSTLRDDVNTPHDPRLLADCEAVLGVLHD